MIITIFLLQIIIKMSSPQVPSIYWNFSSKRILTMEFAEGGQVDDRDYIKKHGINVNEVRSAVIT